MDRLRRLSPADVDPQTAALLKTFLEERGNIPNMFRTVAHRPAILSSLLAHFRSVMGPGTVPVPLKEMLVVRVSKLNGCHY